ncbi:MAG: hypothetical protein A3J55_03350 [Candidatus Ryanbacteria bacterium RIFCSPHIGHO2_02_FULL_45_17b]|uniref:Uncharacterized protein n=1 Tax=Candidatus Ryanbacteria bacterium RIFCSPHIGHO2_01_FULL_45_22 TaxID=1802114 RepID=A0A1G2G1Z5_9BACT|nr:MAG: hypothetical protein A2719_04550 [Candidatus Ryanbacteria bacterium RIFCSPHIGHO2_01_FULL_45_22]OGZ47497.1 MAG: hypothetical protein A3J55_03350 [Candidatus Ryanbacteria bacterium RIFCSPHIGHO2_02_FULL_45_17b]
MMVGGMSGAVMMEGDMNRVADTVAIMTGGGIIITITIDHTGVIGTTIGIVMGIVAGIMMIPGIMRGIIIPAWLSNLTRLVGCSHPLVRLLLRRK